MPEHSETALSIALGSAHLDLTTIGVQSYGGDYVAASYSSLPANQPHSYQNAISLWNSSVIPWGVPPLGTQRISANQQNGIETLTDITVSATTYILGYGTGPAESTVCACVLLDAGGSVTGADSVNIGIGAVGTSSLTIRYHVLSGYLPGSCGNWVGVWPGYVSPYNSAAPLGTALIPDVTDGTVTIRNIAIGVQTVYTVIYFMAEPNRKRNNPRAAALLTFSTAAALSALFQHGGKQ